MSDYGGRLIRDTEPTVNTTTASGIWTIEEALKYKKAGTWPTFTGDPNFKQTVLLLHGDGTNGAQNNTFLDSSTNNFTITRNGNTTQGTFSPFSVAAGECSNYFDGSGDYLSVADAAALELSNNNFCIEFWINTTSGSQYDSIYTREPNALSPGTGNFSLMINSASATAGDVAFWCWDFNSYSAAMMVTTGASIRDGAWHHVAVVRNGSSWAIYIDGVSRATTTSSITIGNISASYWIGNNQGTPTRDFIGYLSNFRVVVGSAVYTSAFTPSTAPLTAITNTSLLTCQSNRFVDNSTNAFAITRNGDVRVTPFSPFAPTAEYSAGTNGGSGYFDGTGDYLQAASSTEYNFGTGDFTIEFWVYPIAGGTTSSYTLLPLVGSNGSFSTGESVNWNLWYDITGGTKIVLERQVSGTYSSVTSNSYTLPFLSWTHISVVRNSGTVTFYANGVSIGGGSFTADINITQALNIGVRFGGDPAFSVGWYGNMYLSGIKIVKGTATAPSGIPTTPPTGGNLLLNFTNAGIIDNTGKNVLETVGNAQIDTAVNKYGTGSLEFDGTGDWLLVPDSPDNQLGTGNFTIEFWVYLNATGAARGFVGKGGASTGWLVSLVSTNTVRFTYGSSTITSTGTLSGSTWHHIAVVREGTGTNQTKIYINGTNDGTGTVSTDFNQTGVMYIGANRTGGDALNGYIDDLRITKGVARYTANFTAPTAPFLDR